MPDICVQLRNIAGTEAAVGWAGSHTVVVDRSAGKAGGLGLGFNGAELLALALGGCFCNDLRHIAHRRGVEIDMIAVDVTLTLQGDPLMAASAGMVVRCTTRDGSDPDVIVKEARRSCMVSNSLSRGVPVSIETSA